MSVSGVSSATTDLKKLVEEARALSDKRMHGEPSVADDLRIDGILTYDIERVAARVTALEEILAVIESNRSAIEAIVNAAIQAGLVGGLPQPQEQR